MLDRSHSLPQLPSENTPIETIIASGPVVFVVDDEPGIIRLCERLLTRAGYQVNAYTDAQEMLPVLQQRHADLLLVDIRMPGLDGFQVIKLARQQYPDLAVVIMTGFGTVETAIEALREGADGLILKPFSGIDLTSSVTRALQQSLHKQDVLRLQALRPLFNVTEALFSETNPRRLRTLILEAVRGHLKCRYAEFYRIKESGERSTPGREKRAKKPPSATRSLEGELTSASLGALVEWLLDQETDAEEQGQPRKPERGKIMPISATSMRAPLLFNNQPGFGIRSIMCSPLSFTTAGQPTAGWAQAHNLLIAARAENEPPFRESDVEMFAILARQAAIAQENARLQAELRDYIRQLEDSQRALIQAEKMAIAGRLTASIAHEINNPLQAVQNCVHLAGRAELTDQDRQNYLALAQSELERLMQTVQRMLDFYRPAALDRKPVDINTVIEKVMSLMDKQLRDHHIQVYLKLAAHLPYVYVVGDQIQQVLLNLVLNAMEAMSPNGQGELFIETHANLAGAQVEVYIKDTGPGVPANERKHIFEPFVSTKTQGTGLGLAVSYGIITAHGGNLELVDCNQLSGRNLLADQPASNRSKQKSVPPDKQQIGACFRLALPVAEYT